MATVVYGDHEPFEIDDRRADLVAYYRGEGATVTVAGDADAPGAYDPGTHTVDEVNDYLESADEGERVRIFELERADKARVGILDGPHAVFDPADHTVDEVEAYLARSDVDDVERQRVLDAERDGQARVGILH